MATHFVTGVVSEEDAALMTITGAAPRGATRFRMVLSADTRRVLRRDDILIIADEPDEAEHPAPGTPVFGEVTSQAHGRMGRSYQLVLWGVLP